MPATTLYTGLDLHKRSVFAFTVDATGEEIAREKLPARADSLALYFADLPVGLKGSTAPSPRLRRAGTGSRTRSHHSTSTSASLTLRR